MHLTSKRLQRPKFLLKRYKCFSQLFSSGLVIFISCPAFAQINTCGQAEIQLQQYMVQVDYRKQYYYNNLPLRCSYDAACMQKSLNYLVAWYEDQGKIVNDYNTLIEQHCSSHNETLGIIIPTNPQGP